MGAPEVQGAAIQAMQPGELHYVCEVYGGWSQPPDIEEDWLYGWFTGEVLWTGAHTFQESSDLGSGGVLYLFPNEIEEFSTGREG